MNLKYKTIFILLFNFICLGVIGQIKIIKELDNDSLILNKGLKYGISKDTNNVSFKYDTIRTSKFEDYLFVKEDGKWGLINNILGNIISCKYDALFEACCYENVDEGKDYFIVKMNNKFGVINYKGEIIIPILYDAITSWVEYGPYAHYVLMKGKIGIIEHGGKIMIPINYDSLYFESNKIIKAKLDNKFGILDSNNNIIIPFDYDALIVDFDIYGWKNKDHQDKFVVKKDNLWKYLDYNGKVLKSDISQQEIELTYKPNKLNNYDFEYIGMMFIK